MAKDVKVIIVRDESVLFPVITLICYVVLFPLGFVLNLIGLITGPKRGCFLAMLLLVFLPVMIIGMIAFLMMGFHFILL